MDWLWKAENFCARHFKKNLFIVAVSILLWKIYRRRKKKESLFSSCSEDVLNIHEALFFRNEGAACHNHLLKKDPCVNGFEELCPAYNLRVIQKYLKSATESIDVCILHLTIFSVADNLVRAHSNGVRIRIISDHTMSFEKSRIPFLKKKGILVKMKEDFAYQMHNKFVIVDKKILMTGSLNWTKQGFCGNWDNIMILSEPYLVSQYLEEFENLWSIL